jgi:hypothetical protein
MEVLPAASGSSLKAGPDDETVRKLHQPSIASVVPVTLRARSRSCSESSADQRLSGMRATRRPFVRVCYQRFRRCSSERTSACPECGSPPRTGHAFSRQMRRVEVPSGLEASRPSSRHALRHVSLRSQSACSRIPELRRQPKETRELQRRVGSDAALPQHDLGNRQRRPSSILRFGHGNRV